MIQQEKIVEKWKTEHKSTCGFFEKSLKGLETENRMLKDKVIKLKSQVAVFKEEKYGKAPDGAADSSERRSKSRGADKREVSKDRKKK